jgi:hypothetical protein
MRLCIGIPSIQLKTILGHHDYIDTAAYRAKIGA